MKIKQIPEDFIVEELIEIPLEKSGNQTYFWLTKKGWTTEKALREIAKKCRVSYKRFKFAGTKDKIAITRQAVSAFKVPAKVLQEVKLKDISIEIIGYGNVPISLGKLKGNKFKVKIRDLKPAELTKLKKNLSVIKKRGFRNYFGEQRFGKGNTHLIGKAILKGDLESAVKEAICYVGRTESKESKKFRLLAKKKWGNWQLLLEKIPEHLHLEKDLLLWLIKHPTDFAGALRVLPKHIRKLYIHAYQSWLWNSAVRIIKKLTKKTLAVPGFNTKLGKDVFSRTIKKLLDKDKLTLEDFKCARMPELAVEGEVRNVTVKPKSLKIISIKDDNLNKGKKSVLLHFILPKSSYATVLLDALFDEKLLA
ncbi:MAG: tRNA pseudouridine(13) synthase TruD [Candidatus Nanoarchaeia archaeon]